MAHCASGVARGFGVILLWKPWLLLLLLGLKDESDPQIEVNEFCGLLFFSNYFTNIPSFCG